MSTYATEYQYPMIEVEYSPITTTDNTDYVLLPPTNTPKSCCIGFGTNLTESAQALKKQEFHQLRDICERIKRYSKTYLTKIMYACKELKLKQAKSTKKYN